MGNNMGAALVDDALEMAVTRRKPGKGVIHHSDHGSQYKSLLLGRTMRRYGIVPSMGAIASPWDNAVPDRHNDFGVFSMIYADHKQTPPMQFRSL